MGNSYWHDDRYMEEMIMMGKIPYGHYRRGTSRNNDPLDMGFDAHDDPTRRLKSPHYTEERYKHAQTIYGRRLKTLGYDYSDRFLQWDHKKWEEAQKNAEGQTTFEVGSVHWYEYILSYFFHEDKIRFDVSAKDWSEYILVLPIEIKHVLAGYNVSDGFPYHVFGYRKRRKTR